MEASDRFPISFYTVLVHSLKTVLKMSIKFLTKTFYFSICCIHIVLPLKAMELTEELVPGSTKTWKQRIAEAWQSTEEAKRYLGQPIIHIWKNRDPEPWYYAKSEAPQHLPWNMQDLNKRLFAPDELYNQNPAWPYMAWVFGYTSNDLYQDCPIQLYTGPNADPHPILLTRESAERIMDLENQAYQQQYQQYSDENLRIDVARGGVDHANFNVLIREGLVGEPLKSSYERVYQMDFGAFKEAQAIYVEQKKVPEKNWDDRPR
jgi:hypothetical protein